MAEKSNNIATPKSGSEKGNRRKKCDSSNPLPVVVSDTNATNTSSEIILYQPDNIISPNYHRIIHKNNPCFNRKKYQFEFENGKVLKLKLYEHLKVG